MRKILSFLVVACLAVVPMGALAEVTTLESIGVSIDLPEDLSILSDETDADTGTDTVVLAAGEDAPLQYTITAAPLAEGMGTDIGAMDESASTDFAKAVLGDAFADMVVEPMSTT